MDRMENHRHLLEQVGRRLLRRFGPRQFTLREEPLGSLFWTVLSQNTTDLTADRAYRQLRRTFRSWRDVRAARRGEVEAAIRVCGLAQQKARTIQEFLERLERERGALSIAFLGKMPADQAMDWLTASRGIGTKTAAVLLLFAFGRPVFPVDTHIRRVSGRLGFVPEGTAADKVQEALSAIAPESAADCAQLHLDIIRLGREICHPRRPECPKCPLRAICRHARVAEALHPSGRESTIRGHRRRP
ncbi:MAG TPA: endonuclease III [Planctomycetota bacterium]|nr:endonuclease III [Planctomycetota bacterium]